MSPAPYQDAPPGAPEPPARAAAPEPPPDLTRVPPPPRAPSPLARQLVFAYQGSQRVKLILGVCFTLVGGPATLPAVWGLPGEVALALSATPGTGTVTRVELNPAVRMNRRPATTIEFTYKVDGETYAGAVNTIDGRAISLARRPRTPLPIEYALVAPGFARVQGTGYSFFGFAAAAFLIAPLLGLALWIAAWRSNRREVRAFRHGIAVAAPIVERSFDTHTTSNGRHPRVIGWRFAVGGRPYTGSISHLDAAMLDRTLPGVWVVALYDPRDPAVNTVWIA